MSPNDLNLKTWRELNISQNVCDLVTNLICDYVPIFVQWTYLTGIDRSIYDNQSMHEKYKRSDVAYESIAELRKARGIMRDETYERNYYSEEYDAHMYESLEYAQSHLLLSNDAMLNIIEFVGVGMASLPIYKPPIIEVGNLFQLLYTVYCLHERMGVVHTDLHLNNMTFKFIPPYKQYRHLDYHTMFIADNTNADDTTFIFKNGMFNFFIIDFSRSIVGPEYEQYLDEANPERFYHDQNDRVLKTIARYSQKFAETHQEQLKAAILTNLDYVVKILSLVDYISIGKNISGVFTEYLPQISDEKLKANITKIITIANDIYKFAQDRYITYLVEMCRSISSGEKLPEVKFSGLEILTKFFNEYTFTNLEYSSIKDCKFSSIQRFDNPMKYSISTYEKYPKFWQIDEVLKLKTPFVREELVKIKNIHPIDEANMIAEKVRIQEEALDGPAKYTRSSWLD